MQRFAQCSPYADPWLNTACPSPGHGAPCPRLQRIAEKQSAPDLDSWTKVALRRNLREYNDQLGATRAAQYAVALLTGARAVYPARQWTATRVTPPQPTTKSRPFRCRQACVCIAEPAAACKTSLPHPEHWTIEAMAEDLSYRPLPLSLMTLFSLLCITSCSGGEQDSPHDFNTQQSAAAAMRELQSAHPAGSLLATAQEKLEGFGFHCQPTSSAAAGYKTSVLCTLHAAKDNARPLVTSPPVPVLWNVGFHSADGIHIDRLVVNRAPQDIGE